MDIPKELRESGLKATLPRLRILQLFHESKAKHLSAEDVYRIGAVLKHERYADKAPGAKLMSSVFALHSGRFFGLAGAIVLMAASALMPLFAVIGWMLYLGRRKKRAAPAAEAADARADATLPL